MNRMRKGQEGLGKNEEKKREFVGVVWWGVREKEMGVGGCGWGEYKIEGGGERNKAEEREQCGVVKGEEREDNEKHRRTERREKGAEYTSGC